MSADERRTALKSKIRDWWAAAPMTYAEEHGATEYHLANGSIERVDIGSKRFFELADETFYRWNEPLRGPEGPFAKIFNYPEMRGRRVLEIGCGMGCMAMNWAQRGADVTAIDLNPVSIAQTKLRFELFGLSGDVREADAEDLPFADDSFDFVYSWGVLHHTPGIRQAIDEVYRVLRPGCRVGLMLYNRESILYRYSIGYAEGIVNAERFFLDELALASRYGDGARAEGNSYTWPVTRREVRRDLMPRFINVTIDTFGTDVPETLNAWAPRLDSFHDLQHDKGACPAVGLEFVDYRYEAGMIGFHYARTVLARISGIARANRSPTPAHVLSITARKQARWVSTVRVCFCPSIATPIGISTLSHDLDRFLARARHCARPMPFPARSSSAAEMFIGRSPRRDGNS